MQRDRSCLKEGALVLTCRLSLSIGRSVSCSSQNGKKYYQKTHQTIFRQIASQVSAVMDNSRSYLEIIELNRQPVEEGRKLMRERKP